MKKLKPSTWIDKETLEPVYGIKINHEGKWMNACEGSNPLLYKTEADRDDKIQKMKQYFKEIENARVA